MNTQNSIPAKKLQQNSVSRRNLIRGAAGAALATGFLRPNLVRVGTIENQCKAPSVDEV